MAVIIVVIGCNDIILLPSSELELISPTASVQTENAFVVVDKHHERLVFANKNKEVVRVLEVDSQEVPFDKVHDVYAVDDHIYVLASVAKDKGIVLSKEILAEYSPEGKYLNNRHCLDYSFEENLVRPGFQYVEKSDWGLLFASTRGAEIKFEEITFQGARVLASKKLDFIPWKVYPVEEMTCLIQGADGWYRFYDGKKNTVTLLDRVGSPYEEFGLEIRQLPNTLSLSNKLLCKTCFFWCAAVFLILLCIYWVVCGLWYLAKDYAMLKKFLLGLGAVVLAGIISGFYTNYVSENTIKHYSTMAEVECRFAYNILLKHHCKLFGILQKKDINDILNNYEENKLLQNYATAVLGIAITNGPKEAFSGALLIKDKEGKVRIVADTTLDEPDGTVYWDADISGKDFTDKPDVFVADDEDVNGKYLTAFRKLYRDDGTCFGFLNLDVNTKKIISAQKSVAIGAFLGLLCVMIGLYITSNVFGIVILETKRIWEQYKAGENFVGGELIGTCTFWGGIFICMTDVLWVFALKELCVEGMVDFNKLLGITIVGDFIMRFLGSAVFSKLHARYNDRSLVISSLSGYIATVGMCLLAFVVHNPWIYILGWCAGSFFAYKPFLFLMSLQFKDNHLRTDAVNKYHRFYMLAKVGGILLGAAIYKFSNFFVLYACILALIVLVSPLIIICSSKKNTDLIVAKKFEFKEIWHIFGNVKGLGFLFSYSFSLKILSILSATIFAALFAKSGIDANMVTYFTIYGFTLATIFPTEKIAEKYGYGVTSFIYSIFVILGLLLTLGNKSMGWLIIVFIVSNVLIAENLRDNLLFRLADREGYDKVVINDVHLIVDNVSSIVFSWLLGIILLYQEDWVCALVGMIVLAFLGIGYILNLKGYR